MTRTHTCGALRAEDVGAEVVLLGWVHRVRDLGGVTFIDIRDRGGLSQLVVRENDALMAAAKRLRSEFVVGVHGIVQRRSDDTVNPKLGTGEVEILVRDIRILNEAKTPPFQIAEDSPVSEDVRLRYRYLDLRRPRLQHNIGLRHRTTIAIRKYFDANGFWEIETPILTKSTPEGARDYLVPSRVHAGEFYALPQSPQIFKQILMIAGTDRYFQIVRCFRDEDLRADRQPEFTQVDVEMSFARPETIYGLIEPLMQQVCREIGRDAPAPFRRMAYAEAIARYGSDKPDLRVGLEIRDLSDVFRNSEFRVFKSIVADGGVVRGIVLPGGNSYSGSQLRALGDHAVKQLGFSGLIWARPGEPPTCSTKAIGESELSAAFARTGASRDDLLLLAAGAGETTSKLLGGLRLYLAKKDNLIDTEAFEFLWVTDFPLLEYHEDDGRWYSMHHPFTSPHDDDVDKLESDPGAVRAKAYDLVLNGSEIGGGSIRIHDAALQARIFQRLGISDEDAKMRFGFFLEALEYGTPPHGGIALGLDRMVAILAGESSIREVMAFPKTANAVDLMAGSPSTVDPKQLRELHLKTQN
ncbi:MAG TPA: aspartate--tRNA ligase [Vicinamibacterales bacterium]|nr:aspartate--tRNA ligase [Vicinamibacterales bacterium]